MIKFFKKSISENNTKKIEEYKQLVSTLTPAESKVYNQVIQGYGVNEVNKILDLKETTVKNHLKSILKKLNVSSKVELIKTYGSIYNCVNNINTKD